MNLSTVNLQKTQTSDGLGNVNKNLAVGTELIVDLDTLREEEIYHWEKKRIFKKPVVNVLNLGFIYTECVGLL